MFITSSMKKYRSKSGSKIKCTKHYSGDTDFFDIPSPGIYNYPMLKSILSGLADLVFPRHCILCRQYHPRTALDPVCPSCRNSLPWNTPPFCARCSRHLQAVSEESLCPSCRQNPPRFDEAWALLRYESTARDILQHFKFHNKTSLRHTFTTMLAYFINQYSLRFPNAAAVIPMPLHPVRLRERGYNQAGLLAESAAHILGLPCRYDILERTRATPRQSELDAKERWTNIKGAFRIKPLADITGSTIILVDDIVTTGATASEAAGTLKDAGASRVIIISLAIASCESCATTSLTNA